MKSPKYVFHCFEGRYVYIYIYNASSSERKTNSLEEFFYFLIKTHFDVTIFPNEEYIKGKIPKMSCQVPNSTSTWDHNENIETKYMI
jgi:hypothetical protein